MAFHRPMGTPRYPAGPVNPSFHRYESPNYYGIPANRHHDRKHFALPPIRTIGLDWGDSPGPESREACGRDPAQLPHLLQQIPAIHGFSSASLPCPPSAPSPGASHGQARSVYSLLNRRNMLDGDFDDSTEGLKRRAVGAHDIVHRYFGQMVLSTLRCVTRTVDANRPLFGSDLPKTRTALTTLETTGKRGKISNHSRVEQLRRGAHAVMLAELGKRACDAIMELAGYKFGSRKPPGKNHLHLAAIFQKELDSLIHELAGRAEQHNRNLEQHVQDLEHRLHDSGQNQAQSYSSSPRRRSTTSNNDDSALQSPRKRQRLSNDDTVAPEGLKALAWRDRAQPLGSENCHIYDSADHHGEHSDHEMAQTLVRPRKMLRPRHQQHSSFPSPAPSTSSSWTVLSRRGDTPLLAP